MVVYVFTRIFTDAFAHLEGFSMIPRLITSTLQRNLKQFPIVSVTGPRQSGKTTLLKHTFTEFDYVSLEDPDVRAFAEDDPRSFLRLHQAPLIIDEAQRVPSIFSYLQGKGESCTGEDTLREKPSRR